MKKIITSVFTSALFTSAFALNVSKDTTIANGKDMINFTAPNVTLTITGTFDKLWYSPRANFGDDYVYTNGDKVTVKLESGASLVLDSSQAGLFGGDGVSTSNVDMYITGDGTISTTLDSVTTSNAKGKLYLDAFTDFTNASYTIGATSQPTNLTLTNSLIVNKLTIAKDSILTMASDADSSADICVSGASATINGSFVQTAGKYEGSNTTTVVTGTLDLAVSKGFVTRWFTAGNGSTIIIRADNAIMQSDTTYRVFGMSKDSVSTLKLYADQQFADLWFTNDNTTGTLNAYTNGNALTFSSINSTGTLNIFIEEDFSWENDKIHFTNATVEKVTSILGTITIGDTVVDESLWDIVSDGNKGVYVNLISVPEPAEWAMIFGAIALGFIAYRRRK